MKKIGIIVFWFGKFPWYHNFFIDSCRRNKDIDFLFFTDNFNQQKKDLNIEQIPFSINEFNKLATSKLGFKVNVLNGLKICDLRPAFGLIFEDFLEEYDFWGYSDTDIIFGNLSSFLDKETLNNYDFISVRDDYPSGYFALFKNNLKMKFLFQKSKDYKQLFLRGINTLFEECGGAYNEVCSGVNILDSSCKYETLHHILERNKSNVKSLFEFYCIEGNVGDISVNQDKIIFNDKFEIMMYHLTSYKSNIFSIIPKRLLKPPFRISKYTFHKLNFISRSIHQMRNLKINFKRYLIFQIAMSSKLNFECNVSGFRGVFEKKYVYMDEIIFFKNIDNRVCLFYKSKLFVLKSILIFKQYILFIEEKVIIQFTGSNSLFFISEIGRKKKYALAEL